MFNFNPFNSQLPVSTAQINPVRNSRKPPFIATQMGHVSSQMVHSVYGAWMSENSDDQIKLLNEKLAIAPHVPQAINEK
ncbi:hypothetical protein PXH59_08205 [Xenorhabdus sp. SF857]|uniref:hypothetical protein n=1 Tax=Xenorhabdus bakwenae TaxID=3026967 RepID=UPI0025582AFE|nr:hypothetical protein [Xenorhabdus sp. SF857]WFQ81052.1 hypothetical protein PXH59_08205 [Xenorhabdus sp. SF857]